MWDVIGIAGVVLVIGCGLYFLSRLIGSEQSRDRSQESNDDRTSGTATWLSDPTNRPE
jgi:hypothetical protein